MHVSGTLGVGPDGRPPQGAYAQSVAAFERIEGALEALGASLETSCGRACSWWTWSGPVRCRTRPCELFADVLPASTMIGVAGFVGPDFLVEIEAEAIVSDRLTGPGPLHTRRLWRSETRRPPRPRAAFV